MGIQVDTMPAGRYFTYAAELLKVNPPHITDQPMIAQLKKIGIEPGKSIDFDKADPAIRNALVSAREDRRNSIKRRRKSFPGPFWCMRSADHSSRQRHDGPSIHIGATTQSGPINWPARSLPLAARRKDGCGESESRNQGHWLVFGYLQPHFANRPIRRAPAIVVCAGSPLDIAAL
jgi:hypothetical protein